MTTSGYRTFAIAIAVLIAAMASGCATTGETVRPGEQVQREEIVRTGVVENVRDVQIENTRPSTGAGSAVGAVVGGIIGSQVGQGRGSIVSSVIGAVLGGLAGHAAEQQGGRQAGVEIAIKLDDGRAISIVQAAGEVFRAGDRVRVISDGITARVTRQ
ncbi:MAG: glycine zipper 2TM domain-containing protein [Burkholderiales bacterium]